MGIKQLSRLILKSAPGSVKERKISHYFNRVLAIDASMCLYQFLISIRSDSGGALGLQLSNSSGKVTSHLSGMFYRTIKLLESGIKPVYVFDGKSPSIKKAELERRANIKAEAEEKLKKAYEEGEKEKIKQMKKRTVRVSKEEFEDTIRLLKLMGVPVVRAPGEAEAQCAEMCKSGAVHGVATEDMDALTFGAPLLVRNALKTSNSKDPIFEYSLRDILSDFGIEMSQFIDVCILCGCDYTGKIAGIGPKRALDLIKKHGSIEGILKNDKKFSKEENKEFLFAEARRFFVDPDVVSFKNQKHDFKWAKTNEEELIEFMVKENGFNIDRIKNGLARIKKAHKKGGQTRLDDFFNVAQIQTDRKTSRKRTNEMLKKAEENKLNENNSKKAK